MTCFSNPNSEEHLNLSEPWALSGYKNFGGSIIKQGEGAASANSYVSAACLPPDLSASAPLQLFYHQNNFSFL